MQAHHPSEQGVADQVSWPASRTGIADRFDRPDQPVGPVQPVVEQKAESEMPVLAPCIEETLLVPLVQDDEELVDHEDTPRMQ